MHDRPQAPRGPRRPGHRGRGARRARSPPSTSRTGVAPPRPPGWDVATSVAHLAWTDEVAVLAATDKAGWDAVVLEAIADPTGSSTPRRSPAARLPPPSSSRRWRAGRSRLAEVLAAHPAGEKLPWFGPPMSPTSMATARLHGDLGARARRRRRARRHRRAARPGAARGAHRGADPRLLLRQQRPRRARRATSGSSSPRPAARPGRTGRRTPTSASPARPGTSRCSSPSAGTAADLDLVADGADADRWLDIAQAFAGPSGDGRDPRRRRGLR